MRILRIIYDWPKPWSGLAPHPYELTLSQVKQGHKVDVFAARWPKSGPEQIDGATVTTFLREPFQGSVFFTTSILMFFYYLKWRKTNKPDIVHSHGHFAIWIYLYRLFLKKYFPWADELKIPLVVHFHRTAKGRWEKMVKDNKPISNLAKNFIWPLEVFSDKISVQVAASCIFVSNENLAEAIKYYNVDKTKCFVVESGVNTTLFKPVGPEERDKSRYELGVDVYDKVILNHGVMVERKNVHLLVDVLKLLPQHYKLLLVGSGDNDYLDRIDEMIKKAKLEDRVIKAGYTPYPEVAIAYQVSDIFVLPSSWEGVPKVVMQGLACGTPCLVSGFKLSEEINGLYYLENLDPANIANKIVEIVDSHPSVDVNKTVHFYSWDKRIKEIDKAYEFAKNNYL